MGIAGLLDLYWNRRSIGANSDLRSQEMLKHKVSFQ